MYVDVFQVPASILGEGTVEDVEVVENHTAYLACPAEGIPPPSILWLRNKAPLLDFPYPNLRELSNGRQLELRNVQVGDEGIFECKATNVAGQKSKTFKVKVHGLFCICNYYLRYSLVTVIFHYYYCLCCI